MRIQTDDHVERLIDESLEETFPASDPPAPAVVLAARSASPAVAAADPHERRPQPNTAR